MPPSGAPSASTTADPTRVQRFRSTVRARAGRQLPARALTCAPADRAPHRRRDEPDRLAGLLVTAGAVSTRFGIFLAGQASAADPRYTVVPQRERLAGSAAAGSGAGAAAGK